MPRELLLKCHQQLQHQHGSQIKNGLNMHSTADAARHAGVHCSHGVPAVCVVSRDEEQTLTMLRVLRINTQAVPSEPRRAPSVLFTLRICSAMLCCALNPVRLL